MIEKMHSFNVLVANSEHIQALNKLRELGVLHINKTSVSSNSIESLDNEIATIDKVLNNLIARRDKKIEPKSLDLNSSNDLVLHLDTVIKNIESKKDYIIELKRRYENQVNFGSFPIQDQEFLKNNKVIIRFYTIDSKKLDEISDIEYVVLKNIKSDVFICVTDGNKIDSEIATRIKFDYRSLSELEEKIITSQRSIEESEKELFANTQYIESIKELKSSLEQSKEFTQVRLSSGNYDKIIRISGYVPESELKNIVNFCDKNNYGYIHDEASVEEEPPTKVKYKKGVGIISPVFKILDTIPGYREKDISFWFLLFFIVFFAMIIGDAGYGLLFLVAAGIMIYKKKGFDSNSRLLLVLSSSTIVWGALTGTWFGSSLIIDNVKFLQTFVVDSLANYQPNSEGVWVSTNTSQNNVIRICFTLGVIQLSLAYIINFISQAKSGAKAVAQIGNLFIVDALFFLVLNLVLGDNHNTKTILYFVLAGFVLVTLFGQQEKGISFFKGILKGLAELLTTFLDMVGSFSNIISYIRLFAVGLASVAISQSFNNMAYQLFDVKTIIFAIVIIILGHSLNIVMGLLSVVVHGVRLNLLEFSGQLNMEWSGREYNPFRIKSPVMENKENV